MTNDKRIGGLRNSLASHSEPVRQILRVSSRLKATTDEILPSGRGAFGPTGKTMNTLNRRNKRNISVSLPSVPRFPDSFPASRAKRATPQLQSGGIGCPMYKEGGKKMSILKLSLLVGIAPLCWGAVVKTESPEQL